MRTACKVMLFELALSALILLGRAIPVFAHHYGHLLYNDTVQPSFYYNVAWTQSAATNVNVIDCRNGAQPHPDIVSAVAKWNATNLVKMTAVAGACPQLNAIDVVVLDQQGRSFACLAGGCGGASPLPNQPPCGSDSDAFGAQNDRGAEDETKGGCATGGGGRSDIVFYSQGQAGDTTQPWQVVMHELGHAVGLADRYTDTPPEACTKDTDGQSTIMDCDGNPTIAEQAPTAHDQDSTNTLYANSVPAAPSDLVATATGPTSISLVWIDHAYNEQKFRVYQGGNLLDAPQPGHNAQSTTVGGLAPTTNYCFRLDAVSYYGRTSPQSNEACATTGQSGQSGQPVGGIADFPGVDEAPARQSGPSANNYAVLAGWLAAAVVALATGGWYARRRWLR